MSFRNKEPERLIRLSEVLHLIPVSRSTWYAGMAYGRYPKPVKISGRAVAWRLSEVIALLEHEKSGVEHA